MKHMTLSTVFVLAACCCIVSCSKKDAAPEAAPEPAGPVRIESTLNQTGVNQDYIVEGKYWYVEDEDTVAMVCNEGNYDLKLDFSPEQKALIEGLDDTALYDITFTATEFAGDPTETKGVLIAVEKLPSEE
ncbi:MAG: hypothetical protein PHP44_05950 [Kiritimatiellae bacterium]|nr:hypothetical protein [Kiritimatiellia bacterium]